MKNRTKKVKAEMKFEELVDHASRDIHSALLTDGAKGMRTMIYLWLSKAIEWHCGEKP